MDLRKLLTSFLLTPLQPPCEARSSFFSTPNMTGRRCHRTTEAIPRHPWKSKSLCFLTKKQKHRDEEGCARGTTRYFLHSFPSHGPPVVQSYQSRFFFQKSPRLFFVWPPLQSLAVKKTFLCKFWAVQNFQKSASEKFSSGLRGALNCSVTFWIVFRIFFSRFSNHFSCQLFSGAVSFCRRAALTNLFGNRM